MMGHGHRAQFKQFEAKSEFATIGGLPDNAPAGQGVEDLVSTAFGGTPSGCEFR
jgi:hypothetical protein